ncbi:MAG: hypothetical protein ABIG95_00420 [Candidatus Woesearchaeota archaeon]
MSINLTPEHKQTAEVELLGHPDIFCTRLAARLVRNLAIAADSVHSLHDYRADLNCQALGRPPVRDVTPVIINIGGQLNIAEAVDYRQVAFDTTRILLMELGYLDTGVFSTDHLEVNLEGITAQSVHLTRTTLQNEFADTCVVYGHHIKEPFGLNGTFAPLVIGQQITLGLESTLANLVTVRRPDGKIKITTRIIPKGFTVERIFASLAYEGEFTPQLREQFRQAIVSADDGYLTTNSEVIVNSGGLFDVYFLQADAGTYKAKDDIIITGGIHQLGTDGVWGKCLFKASTIAIPWAFALAKVVCDTTGARYSCVSVDPQNMEDRSIQFSWRTLIQDTNQEGKQLTKHWTLYQKIGAL